MEIEQEAKLQGWLPQEEYKGNPERWIDAETYVERGRQIMPILQNNNKRYATEIDNLKSTVESLKVTIENQTQSMEDLKQFHAEASKAQVEKARRDLLAELKMAKTDGDVDQEIKLTSDLSKFDAAQVAQEKSVQVETKTVAKVPSSDHIEPYVKQWTEENPWYGVDQEKTDMMNGVAQRLRTQGSPLKEKAFLEEAARIVEERYASQQKTPVSKVEGASRGESTSRQGTLSYANLPAEAKDACEKQSSRFVGPDKVYKTKKEWQDYYTSIYNSTN